MKECASRVIYELEKERINSVLDKDKRNWKWLLFYIESRTMAKYYTDQRYKDHDRLNAHAQKIVCVRLLSCPQPFASLCGCSQHLGHCVGSLVFSVRFLQSHMFLAVIAATAEWLTLS